MNLPCDCFRFCDFDSRWWEPATEIGTHQDTSVLVANDSPSALQVERQSFRTRATLRSD